MERKMTKTPSRTTPFHIASDMEDDVADAIAFANAIAMMAESFDEAKASAIQRLAWAIRKHCDAIEDRRVKLFHLLHPNRAEFETHGWPDAQGDASPAN
jgi:hypothetical protein